MGENDDDPAIYWGPDAATSVDRHPPVAEADTTPHHRSLDYLAGRESGFGEGVELIAGSLRRELDRAGLGDVEARKICSRVREAALRRG